MQKTKVFKVQKVDYLPYNIGKYYVLISDSTHKFMVKTKSPYLCSLFSECEDSIYVEVIANSKNYYTVSAIEKGATKVSGFF